jgi:cation diffusion facilitator family transporter
MHKTHISLWQHSHVFSAGNERAEKRAWVVFGLTAAMMAVEIVAGWLFGSMALLADGWHMSTHALALGITAIAYLLARRYISDARFAFGTWKIEILGGFVSAILLGVVALYMASESVHRFFKPLSIKYNQAIIVAVIGLAVNVASAFILKGHGHEGHSHHDDHDHNHKDLNIHAAYLHVVADALTSVLAIAALLGVKYMGWNWLDPCMGIVGAIMIIRWTYGLLRETGNILLDREMDAGIVGEIHQAIESDGDTRISDLHVWRVGRDKIACIVALVSSHPQNREYYKKILQQHEELAHITIEISPCSENIHP